MTAQIPIPLYVITISASIIIGIISYFIVKWMSNKDNEDKELRKEDKELSNNVKELNMTIIEFNATMKERVGNMKIQCDANHKVINTRLNDHSHRINKNKDDITKLNIKVFDP